MFLHGRKIHIACASVIHMASCNLRLIREQFKQKFQTIKVLSVLSSFNVIDSDLLFFHWPVNDILPSPNPKKPQYEIHCVILTSAISVCVYYISHCFCCHVFFFQCVLFLFIITLLFINVYFCNLYVHQTKIIAPLRILNNSLILVCWRLLFKGSFVALAHWGHLHTLIRSGITAI